MKALLLAALLVFPALRARADNAQAGALGDDPLTVSIRRTAIRPDAGIDTVVRLASGQTISLKVVNLDVQPVGGAKVVSFSAPEDALGGLKPAEGLIEKRKAVKNRKLPKAAKEQLTVIKKDGWTPPRGVGHRGSL